MKALITFTSYSSNEQKMAAYNLITTVAEENNWIVTGNLMADRTCILADTVAKTATSATGQEAHDNTYDALTQLNTILNAIKNNTRNRILIGGYWWMFESNGDVYVNKILIPSATFNQIISARNSAMT